MKKMLVLVAVLLTVNSYAQKVKETEVPKAVLESFNKNFAGAKVEEWKKEKDGYEAEFDWNKEDLTANFATDGKLLETEAEIATKALPVAITEYMSKNYSGYKIEEAFKMTNAYGKVTYETEVEKGKEEFDLIFDSNGGFVEKKVKEEGKKEGKDKD